MTHDIIIAIHFSTQPGSYLKTVLSRRTTIRWVHSTCVTMHFSKLVFLVGVSGITTALSIKTPSDAVVRPPAYFSLKKC